MAPSMPFLVGNGLPTSRSSIPSVQWRICWRSAAGHAEDLADHLDRERRREVLDGVEGARALQLVEEPVDHPLDERLPLGDAARA